MQSRTGDVGSKGANPHIPIVFANVPDPVGIGLVRAWHIRAVISQASLASSRTLAGKWLEALKEVAPYVTRMAVIYNPENQHGANAYASSRPSRRRSKQN